MKNLLIIAILFSAGIISAQKIEIANGTNFKSTNGTVLKVSLGGEFINNSDILALQGTTYFSGTNTQTISGTESVKFGTLVTDMSEILILNQDIKIQDELNMLNGVLDINNSDLIFMPDALISGTFDAESMIAVDLNGKIIQELSTNGEYFFPVGNLTGSSEYSPLNIELTQGNYSSGTQIEIDMFNTAHPNVDQSLDYINRYWTITPFGLSDYTANLDLTYTDADIVGNPDNIYSLEWNGTDWTTYNQAETNHLLYETSNFGSYTGGSNIETNVTVADENDVMSYYEDGNLQISLIENIQIKSISIYNTIGQQIYQTNISNKNKVNLFVHLTAGTYFLRMITNKGITTAKFMVR